MELSLPLPLAATVLRPLTSEDVARLETEVLGIVPTPIAKIRFVHHTIARLLAIGRKAVDVSAVTGISQSRICILQSDPAFKELLAFYANQEAERFSDAQERMLSLGIAASEELQERILESPEEIGTKTLIDIMTSALDRGGHAPKTRHEHAHVVLSKDDLEAIKREVGKAGIKTMPENRGSAFSGTPIDATSVRLDSAPAEGREGEGSQV
jgi:hypothetical protein